MTWIAKFEGWKLPNGSLALNPRGPFIIEVYQDTWRGKYPRWRARLKATGQEIVCASSKSAIDAKNVVNAQFEKRVQDWKEV